MTVFSLLGARDASISTFWRFTETIQIELTEAKATRDKWPTWHMLVQYTLKNETLYKETKSKIFKKTLLSFSGLVGMFAAKRSTSYRCRRSDKHQHWCRSKPAGCWILSTEGGWVSKQVPHSIRGLWLLQTSDPDRLVINLNANLKKCTLLTRCGNILPQRLFFFESSWALLNRL